MTRRVLNLKGIEGFHPPYAPDFSAVTHSPKPM
jgi:hypothetical protein